MKNLLALAVIAAAGAAHSSTSSDLGYVTDGLTAHWDAIDNQATGTHSASATTWVDLVGGAALSMSGTTWGDEYCRFPTAASCGTLAGSSLLAWDSTVSTARTVEVVLKYDSATANGICFIGTSSSQIAIGRCDSGAKWIASSSGAQTKIACTLNHAEFGSVSFGFVKGVYVEGYLYNSANAVAKSSGADSWGGGNSTIYVGSRSGGGTGMVGNIYAVRIYDRLLTAEEVAQNYLADQERFLKETAATVVSGSVTVDGKVYSAGECVPDWRTNATLHVESASAASIRLDGTITGLSLATGSLVLAGDSVQTLASLELGAAAALTLPGDVLTVTGAITADATASVVGPGLLVGTAATSPVALTGGAQYASSTAAWTDWPSSGVAYIPDGASVEITAEDVAKVAALDKIVFCGASAMVTCSISEGYTLSTPLSGPGTFAFVSAGDSVITADNRNFTGSFLITNTTCTVSNEFGLGGVDAQTCDFYVGNVAKSLWFGNVSPVFTNHVAVCEHVTLQSTSAATVTFGTRSTAEVLVQDADFTIANSASSAVQPTYTISGNVKFMKRYGMDISRYWNYPYLSLSAGAGVWFLGTFSVKGPGLLYYFGNGTYHFGLDSASCSAGCLMYSGATLSSAGGNNSCKMNFYGMQQFNVDLNGNDLDFGKYGGGTSGDTPATTSTRSFSLTSAEPAQLRFCGSNTMAVNPNATGAAGLTMAGTGSYTMLGKSGEPCTSTGAIKVEKGTLTLGDTFEWHGTNVTVSGGSLVVGANAPNALSKGVAHLVVTGGTFAVQSGGGVALKSARFGEKTLEDGTYTMAALRADPDVAPFIGSAADDSAEIVVDGEEAGEWTGWHAGDVVVPKNAAVVVTAADLPIISNVTSLTLGNASTVSFPNLGSMDIRFPIAGRGTVSFADSDEVVIFSDNSGLVSPGHFEFARTHVCVSNRFGLGSSATAACMFYTDAGSANAKRLRFKGPAATNDVAVVFDHGMSFGADDPEIPMFVQNADIEQTAGDYNAGIYLTPISPITFNAAIRLSSVVTPQDNVMRFAATSSLMGHNGTLLIYGPNPNKKLYLDAAMPANTLISNLGFQYNYDIYVGADYAIDLKTDAGQVGNGDFWVIDGAKVHLDGHPIRIGSVTYQAANLWKTGDHVEFNSETPTTLYINSIHNYTERSYYHAMKLTGAVSLDYSSKITKQYIGRGYNDTTGSLTVRGGNLYMDYGSYWGGTNVTITGGTLHIGASAATNNVTGVGTFFNSKATLSVEGTGALDIAAGRVEPVWCYRLNGEYQTAGDYPMGSGTLRVRRSSPNEGFIFVFR
ncbi:MAG: hypothetical protein IKE55_08250 [Kiritimatiellae bacterium]|nr:hypothetical protein [Kiritimatiellia bacterium]